NRTRRQAPRVGLARRRESNRHTRAGSAGCVGQRRTSDRREGIDRGLRSTRQADAGIYGMSPNTSDPTESIARVVAFYDAHPINEEQILRALRTRGIPLEGLSEETLKDHDQDHFGGIQANDQLAQAAGLRANQLVLDVCSGMGGPARYLAYRFGCRVVGLDFTESRHLGAQ